jgi:uncharacterized protein YukE
LINEDEEVIALKEKWEGASFKVYEKVLSFDLSNATADCRVLVERQEET